MTCSRCDRPATVRGHRLCRPCYKDAWAAGEIAVEPAQCRRAAIARRLRLSQEGVRQIELRALAKVKKAFLAAGWP